MDHKYKLGLNVFADLTAAEFASYRMHIGKPGKINSTPTLLKTEVAESLNWNTKGAVGPVNNQG